MSENMFDDVELQTPSNTDVSVKDVIQDGRPSCTDPEWHDYVMGHFENNEQIEGRPLVAGLRRVAELLIGRITFSGPTQIFPPQNDRTIRSTVVWTTTFEDGSSFSDVADVWEGNTDDAFCAFSTATAATRAEARSLRKALRIRGVAAEECTKKDTAKSIKAISQINSVEGGTTGEFNEEDRMTESQSNLLDVMGSKHNINIEKLFKSVFDLDVKRKINKSQASDAIKKMNEFRGASSFPDDIKGYSSDWRK